MDVEVDADGLDLGPLRDGAHGVPEELDISLHVYRALAVLQIVDLEDLFMVVPDHRIHRAADKPAG